MKRVLFLAVFIAAVGFAGVAATGVDLVTSRVGMGLVVLGLGGLLISFGSLFKPSGVGRGWLLSLSCLGGFYFIWRAVSGGPIGLALPDIVLVLTFLAVYLVASSADQRGKRILMFALILLCLGNVGVAFAQNFGDQGFFVWKADPEKRKLVSGLFGHYNPFAAFMNGSVFFFLTFVFLGKKISVRVVSGILVVGMLVAVIFSGSRGGWVSLMAGSAIWVIAVLTYLKQRQSKAFGVAMILGILFLVVGLTSSVWVVQKLTEKRAEISSELSGLKASTVVHDGGRMAFQQLAFEIFQDSPVVGMGPRSYSYLSLQRWDTDKRGVWERPPDFAHNEYLQTLSDYGLVGLAIIVLLALAHAITGVYCAITCGNSQRELSLLQIGAIGGFVAILSQCFFSFLLHTPSCMALLALLAGILGSKPIVAQGNFSKAISERFVGGLGFVVSVSLLIIGGILSQSYLLSRKANEQLAQVNDEQSAFRAINTMMEAGHVGRDPKIFEIVGRLSMKFANDALLSKDPALARGFNLEARKAFEGSLQYNPHFAAGIAGLPRVEEALGHWDEANIAHENAMEKLWSREYRLRPHLLATQSSFAAAFRALYAGKREEALKQFREGRRRIKKRREILRNTREPEEEKVLRMDLEGWIAFMEARLLYKEGDQVWRNARPRNPKLAYALMLEARKRYQASEAVVRGKNPNWEKQMKQLQVNIGILKGGQVRPAKLSQGEIESIIAPEAGLDSSPATR